MPIAARLPITAPTSATNVPVGEVAAGVLSGGSPFGFMLGRILSAYPEDPAALRILYLRTLARKPTNREMAKCRDYIKKTGNRAEALEDILWALINSTEFRTRR